MEPWWSGIAQDFTGLGDVADTLQAVTRLLVSAIIGGLIGFERERAGHAAGLRTHMLVTLGATLFVLIPMRAGMEIDDVSRIIQGVTTGIGFLGAGTIIKQAARAEVKGLTTAAAIWVAASLGVAVGFGQLLLAMIASILVLIILAVLHTPESHDAKKPGTTSDD